MTVVILEARAEPIPLNSGSISIDTFKAAADALNSQLVGVNEGKNKELQIYDIMDFRMLSGLIGELFSSLLSGLDDRLQKNPNIDGYPDLCDISNVSGPVDTEAALHFVGGGLEVKNTFGLKKSGVSVAPREQRREKIQRQLVWKAHHPYTNNLLALQSDYVDRVPQVVAAYFSSALTPSDWTEKQNPRTGSTMTSFCQTKRSAFDKLHANPVFIATHWR